MRIHLCLVIATTSLCLAVEVAGEKYEALSGNKVVKRDIFDDFRNLLESAGSNFKTFTQETYNKIADNLPSLGLDDLKKTLNQLKSIYQKIADKSSDEAKRVQRLISEVDNDIAANGSTSWRGSFAGTVALVVLTAYLNN